MRPCSITNMRSAESTVARRWAMTSVVRPHRTIQCLPHQGLALGVKRGGGLVQQQDRRPAQDGAGNGDALALAAGECHHALADRAFQLLRQPGDEFVDKRQPAGFLDFGIGGVRPAEADILADRGGEDGDILRHQRDAGTDLVRIGLRDIDAIDQHPARRGS